MVDPETAVFDIVLMVDAFSAARNAPHPLPQYLKDEVAISEDLFLAPFKAIRRDILDACDRRGINWEPPTKVYPVHCGLARRDPPGRPWAFDPDRRLFTCVQLSRLVRPTSLGFDRAGRVTLSPEGEIVSFVPAPVVGGPSRAWVADPARNWFEDDDISRIAGLVQAFDSAALPERVLQALWHHEHVHQLYYADVRWPLATMGLEALVHTDRHQSTHQFVQRLLMIQEELGASVADENLLSIIYDRRSHVAHGSRLGDLDEATQEQYLALEDLLRLILRVSITSPSFADRFRDADAVRAAWPLV